MDNLITPQKLEKGDRIASVSLSWGGPAAFPYRYEIGKKQIEEVFGLKIVEMPHTLAEARWLKNNPRARSDDLMAAFLDPSIKGIFSTIGGDDSIRTLPFMDLSVIRENPKVFLGFSDSTITHLVCMKAGLRTFYGPSIMTGFAENTGMHAYMIQSLLRTLFHKEINGPILPNDDGWTNELLDWVDPRNQQIKRKLLPSNGWRYLQGEGIHEGLLIGGCIEVMDWLRGSKYWPDLEIWEGAVLFLETSEDGPSPEAVVRYLRTYSALGILKKISGLLFGRPGGCLSPDEFCKYDEAILQVVSEEEKLNNLPVITNMDFGHTAPVFLLPYGSKVRIDCEREILSVIEKTVH